MGATVRARRGELGGLAIDLDLPIAPVPAGLDTALGVLVGAARAENRG
jgi:hypothetical protein